MTKTNMNEEKLGELKSLLSVYRREVEALMGLGAIWKQLSNKAKDVCAKDFDEAIIAREALLEEINKYKSAADIKAMLNEVDSKLMDFAKVAMDLYGFEVKAYLGKIKSLPSP